MSSAFRVAKKRSAMALSSQSPVRLVQDRLTVVGGILAAAIGVVDEPGGRLAGAERHRQGRRGEFRPQVVGHGPADHPAGVGVEEHGQTQPALPGRHVCAIPEPEALRPRRREVARDAVGGGRVARIGDGGARPSSAVAADEAGGAQQARDPAHATADTTHPQRGVDPRRAVGAAAARVDERDLVGQRLVGGGARRDPAVRPRVVAGAGNPQYPAEDRDGVVGPLRPDEPLVVHKVSCAKEAAAFRKISRSCRST